MRRALTGALLAALLLSGCSGKPDAAVAVPLGDHAALEKLAKSWEKVAQQRVGVSPASLPGDERKKFLVMVFEDAGYDYGATLKQMAAKGFDKSDKNQNDLAELVTLPHRDQRVLMDPAQIYSGEELQAIAAIERVRNKP